MATAGPVDGDRLARLAERFADAEFVALSYCPTGDALAATGLLAGALAAIDTPFQARVSHPESDRRDRTERTATDADLAVRVGVADSTEETTPADASTPDAGKTDSLPGVSVPASYLAEALARELGCDPDPTLALAGSVAAAIRDARDPFEESTESAESSGIAEANGVLLERGRERGRLGERRPGIAIPTDDAIDGLAHSTLVHAPFSGNPEDARERCGALAEGGQSKELASLLALATVGAEGAVPRAAIAIERALRPVVLPDSTPVATLGGYADVLECLATERPGLGLALVLGYDVRETALTAWRAHARRAHAALRDATVARYDGLSVARLEAIAGSATGSEVGAGDREGESGTPVATVARLLRDYRSPESVALVLGEDVGALSATEDRAIGTVLDAALDDLEGTSEGTERTGKARFTADPEEFLTSVRGALAEERSDSRAADRRGVPADASVGDRS